MKTLRSDHQDSADSAPPPISQEMQRSAAEARNKNRSAICFDYEPEPRAAPAAPAKAEAKAKVPKVKVPKVKEEVKPGDLEEDLGEWLVYNSIHSSTSL